MKLKCNLIVLSFVILFQGVFTADDTLAEGKKLFYLNLNKML
jgi:hypothetical protein